MKISNFVIPIALFFAGLVGLSPSANAGYTCDEDWMGRQVCTTDSGDTYTIDKDWMNRDVMTGPDGSTTTCDEDWMGRYRCD